MSAPDHSPSGLPPALEVPLEDRDSLGEAPGLSTISARDSELSCLSQGCLSTQSLLTGEQEQDSGPSEGLPEEQHDLAPVHRILVQLAVSLQARVDQAARELAAIRARLARELQATALSLATLGEVKLPSGFPASVTLQPSPSPHSATIAAIHHYRDKAARALGEQAAVLAAPPQARHVEVGEPTDFNTASDRLDSSFQQLRRWLDELGAAARSLQSCDGETNTLRRFSSEQCRDIDSLEREAVLDKMAELSVRSCSIQSRKPVRSLGHTLDLQEIMLLAKNAKSLVYEVSLQMLKIVDLVKGEEIAATTQYHRLTKENSELLRRYCFYLKLKIHQL